MDLDKAAEQIVYEHGGGTWPCACWRAGHDGNGSATQYTHPREWSDGAIAAYEHAYDI